MKNYTDKEDEVKKSLYKKRKLDGMDGEAFESGTSTKRLKENVDVEMDENEQDC